MKIIHTVCGTEVFVDDCDYDQLLTFCWSLVGHTGAKYATTRITDNGKRVIIRMHRMIMNAQQDDIVDHANGDTMNNTRENLRFCDFKGNCRNRRKMSTRVFTSQYKGVMFSKRNCWCAYIYDCNKGQVHLGSYTSEVAAANMYNIYAKKLFGEFARLNDVEPMTEEECLTFRTRQPSSSYCGVEWHKPAKKWTVRIRKNGVREYLGLFESELDAARAYNKRAIELYGENYKRLNIIPETEG